MDFEYEFLFTSATSEGLILEHASDGTIMDFYQGRHDDRAGTSQRDRTFSYRMSYLDVREVDFGEEPVSDLGMSAIHGFLTQKGLQQSSPENAHDRLQTNLRTSVQERIAIPSCAYLQPTARSLSHLEILLHAFLEGCATAATTGSRRQ
jgi:hypothetical protein